ncbi:MAG: DNA polymerase III subunit delta [Vicinamibacteria bacterium]|nr:DNA polymerase III subunit delta [Vicinamibacteria bacterium]
MAKAASPIVLILGQDSLRADRALAGVLEDRDIDASEIVRLWGDESSFADVFTAAASRSLFSDRTVVVVRHAEKLRGGGGRDPEEDAAEEGPDLPEPAEEPQEKGGKRKGAGKTATAPASDLPDLDPSSTLIFVVRKTDRRFGMWKKISKAAELIDVDYLKGKALHMAAFAEAKALGLRVPDDLLKDLVEQSGPSLGRIVSELEKMLLYQGPAGRGAEESVAVTSSPPLYLLADALMLKDKRKSLGLLDEALRQGEAGLRVLATLHGTVRKLALFRALRASGVSSADAGSQLGIFPFKVADTERAARAWSEAEIGRALAIFAEADRRLKLSAPAVPVLTHALARVASGGRA